MTTQCPVCGRPGTQNFVASPDLVLLRCPRCHFVFKELGPINYETYPESYYSKFDFDRSKEVQEIANVIGRHHNRLNDLVLVEIGCGTGVLLDGFRKLGMQVYGFEPSKVAAGIARQKYGLTDIRNEYFSEKSLSTNADVFLLHDVIEHLPDPATLLRSIRSRMKDDSVLIIKSGNPDSYNARLFPPNWEYYHIPEHIAFYSREALRQLSSSAGLELSDFVPFKHAYGGVLLPSLARNTVKSLLLRWTPRLAQKLKSTVMVLANDHFIAVLKCR